MRFFILNWFGQKNPSELLNKHLKYFWFWLRIRQDIRIFVHSACYQNTEIFIPRIISIRTVKFSSNIYLIPRIIRIRKFSFRVLSEYGNFPSEYYQNTEIFIPRILSIRTDSFRVFWECTQIILNIRYWIIFIPAFKGILLQKKVCMCATGPKT